MNTEQNESPFGPVIYAYTRAQAVADGVQVEVTKTAKEAGISFPVFLTRTVFDSFVAVPEGVTGQDEAGRLWDICWMLRFAILRSRSHGDRVPVRIVCSQRQSPRQAGEAHRAMRPARLGRPAARHHRDDAGRRLTGSPSRARCHWCRAQKNSRLTPFDGRQPRSQIFIGRKGGA